MKTGPVRRPHPATLVYAHQQAQQRRRDYDRVVREVRPQRIIGGQQHAVVTARFPRSRR